MLYELVIFKRSIRVILCKNKTKFEINIFFFKMPKISTTLLLIVVFKDVFKKSFNRPRCIKEKLSSQLLKNYAYFNEF